MDPFLKRNCHLRICWRGPLSQIGKWFHPPIRLNQLISLQFLLLYAQHMGWGRLKSERISWNPTPNKLTNLASSSALQFSLWEIFYITNFEKFALACSYAFTYLMSCSSLIENKSLTWQATNLKLEYTTNLEVPTFRGVRSPTNNISFSASLFEVEKFMQTTKWISSPYSNTKITPTPLPSVVEDLSTNTFHISSSSRTYSSAKKFAKV